ncbi:hypothetical protein M0R19_01725 [Candidatus Pacearchaeota archaeon]|nr:hypothetical protein [Candidatus Pacearchaeota archaeon]
MKLAIFLTILILLFFFSLPFVIIGTITTAFYLFALNIILGDCIIYTIWSLVQKTRKK